MKEQMCQPPENMFPDQKSTKFQIVDMTFFEPLREHNLLIVDNSDEKTGNRESFTGIVDAKSKSNIRNININSIPAYVSTSQNKQPIIHVTPHFLRDFDKDQRSAAFKYLLFRAMLIGKPKVEFTLTIDFGEESPLSVNEYDLSDILKMPKTFIEFEWPRIQRYFETSDKK